MELHLQLEDMVPHLLPVGMVPRPLLVGMEHHPLLVDMEPHLIVVGMEYIINLHSRAILPLKVLGIFYFFLQI